MANDIRQQLKDSLNKCYELLSEDTILFNNSLAQIAYGGGDTIARLRDLRNQVYEQLLQTLKNLVNYKDRFENETLNRWLTGQRSAIVGIQVQNPMPIQAVKQSIDFFIDMTYQHRVFAKDLASRLQLSASQRPCAQQDMAFLQDACNVLGKYDELLTLWMDDGLLFTVQPDPLLKKDRHFDFEAVLFCGKLARLLKPLEVSAYVRLEDDVTTLRGSRDIATYLGRESALAAKPPQLQMPNAGNAKPIPGGGQRQSCEFDVLKREDGTSGQFVMPFRQAKISVAARKNKGTTVSGKDETVSNTLYVLLLHVRATLLSQAPWPKNSIESKTFELCAISLPFLITVHNSQDRDSQATILWQYAFTPLSGHEREVQVKWKEFAEALDCRFRNMANVTRGLDEKDLKYMAHKLRIGPERPNVKKAQVFHDPLPSSSGNPERLTFWTWFYEIMNLLSNPKYKLKELWNRRLIYGFISKEDCAELLRKEPVPCFMLRFSDSKAGSICLSYKTPSLEVVHLSPFTPAELSKLPLADRVACCDELEDIDYIYPNLSKSALLEFATRMLPPENLGEGYVQQTIVMKVNREPAVTPSPRPSSQYPRSNSTPFWRDDSSPSSDTSVDYRKLSAPGGVTACQSTHGAAYAMEPSRASIDFLSPTHPTGFCYGSGVATGERKDTQRISQVDELAQTMSSAELSTKQARLSGGSFTGGGTGVAASFFAPQETPRAQSTMGMQSRSDHTPALGLPVDHYAHLATSPISPMVPMPQMSPRPPMTSPPPPPPSYQQHQQANSTESSMFTTNQSFNQWTQ